MLKVAMAAGWIALTLAIVPAAAEPAQRPPLRGDISAQDLSAQVVIRRAPPRLRVYPGGRRLLYRDCDFHLVQQYRPSGPVIVPWQRCWWVRG
jgi:hypothetical protein